MTSLDSKVTGYELVDWDPTPGGGRRFLFATASGSILRPTQPPTQ